MDSSGLTANNLQENIGIVWLFLRISLAIFLFSFGAARFLGYQRVERSQAEPGGKPENPMRVVDARPNRKPVRLVQQTEFPNVTLSHI